MVAGRVPPSFSASIPIPDRLHCVGANFHMREAREHSSADVT